MTWQAYQEFMQAMRVRIAEKASQGLQSGRGVEVNDRVITLDPVIRAAPAVERPVITNVLFADITVTQAVGQIKTNLIGYEPFNGEIPLGLTDVVSWDDLQDRFNGEYEYQVRPEFPSGPLVYSGDYVIYSDGDINLITSKLWISPKTIKARIRFYVRGFLGGSSIADFEDGMNVGTFRVFLQQRATVVSGNDLLRVTKDHEITVGWQGTDLQIDSLAEGDSSERLFVTGVANS
jgi:hypothetical protein